MITRFVSARMRAASRSMVVLPTPGRPRISTLLPDLDQVLDDVDRAVHRPPDPAGQADDVPAPVADGRDAVQRALQAGAVVGVKIADPIDHALDVVLVDFQAVEVNFLVDKTGFWDAPQVQDDF